MSIASMTSLAVVRNAHAPTKADAGVAPAGSLKGQQPPSLTDLLAKTIPVGLVTAYGAFIAAISQLVSEPTAADPSPDQILWARWIAFAALVAVAGALAYLSYRSQAPKPARAPIVEVSAVVVSAIGWGLGLPESPILAAMSSKTTGLTVLALVAFLAVAINLVLAKLMQAAATP
ncbi:MAG: hypothetical protein JWN61_1186 [Pseudonocardiales bacterium]|nr:hypothetical protein [Jatrophihabitantaceae bacterium]MCW2603051.1 hypothetical protein [Pseudonocardiales bacterium]